MNSAFVERLGWTLVHVLWEGALVAAVIGVGLFLARRKSAYLRYGMSCTALFLMALCPIATYLALQPNRIAILGTGRAGGGAFYSGYSGHSSAVSIVIHAAPESFDPAKYLPVIVLIWVIGVAVLTIRLIGGLIQIERLKRSHSSPTSPEWQNKLDELARRLGHLRPVRLLESARIDVPVAMGVLKAVVILPCSVTLHLPSEEIEALLLHELAHLRRYDYLVNLVQTVIETALFYHPAVWWISRTIRIERENCCDDIAVSASASPVVYARALTSLEEVRRSVPNLSMSVNGGLLMSRINRILGIANPSSFRPRVWPSLAVLVSLTTLFGVAVQTLAQSKPPARKTSVVKHDVHVKQSKKGIHQDAKLTANTQLSVTLARTAKTALLSGRKNIVALQSGGKPAQKPTAAMISGWAMVNGSLIWVGKGKPTEALTRAARKDLSAKPIGVTKHLATQKEVVKQPVTTVDVDFTDAPFATAIQDVARQTDTSFVISEERFPKVSLKLSDVPTIEAINAICFAANASWRKQGNIIFFSRQDDGQGTITDRITLKLTDVPLEDAVSRVASLLGAKINLYVEPGLIARNIDLRDATVEEAMRQLAAWAGHPGKWSNTNGVYTITSK